jgi:FkbM family methyltransferase
MKFRPGTVDENVYREVITENCYRIDRFQPSDVVIDVGCHIGCFSRLCAERGAGLVLAFELEPENFAIAEENLRDFPQVKLLNKAVWKTSGTKVHHSGMYMTADGSLKNTGSSHVDFAPGCHTAPGDIETVTLDEIMAPYPEIAMVKLDCEGAEFEIVPATKSWAKVKRLAGEVHGYRKDYHVPDFYTEIRKHFAKLEVNSYCPEYGLDTFFASR